MNTNINTENENTTIDIKKLSPMMAEYVKTKQQYKDCILFYRLGDFYEMFFEDALTVTKELEITLTGKDCGLEERAPMCGVPYHSCDSYIARLIAKGYKVAICEQTEDPATAKGLVDRDIIRVITPGTVIASSMLEEGRNNFLCAIYADSTALGLCLCDISTGEVFATSFPNGEEALPHLENELGRFHPAEAVLSDGAFQLDGLVPFLRERLDCPCENGGEARFRLDAARPLVEKQFKAGLDTLPRGDEGAVQAAGGADSTVYLFLDYLPSQFAVAGLFLISCFVSISMGTSVGTISALAPFAVSMSEATGFEVVLCIAAVASGAMFGDNLSMISDTTIAAVRTQGCEMKDKFRMNFFIVLPAAILTLVIFIALTWGGSGQPEIGTYSVWKVLPYLVVLVGAVAGVNVFLILTIGAVLSLIVGVASGAFPWTQIFSVMGTGITAMYDITVISIVVACIGALVREYGGIQWLIDFIHRRVGSKKGAQLGIAGLVAAVDVATANNTVAIVMSGSIAKEISEEYGIDPRRTASLLDIFASVIQGILPYGAQLLYAAAGAGITALEIVPYMFYCYLMAACAIIFILFFSGRTKSAG